MNDVFGPLAILAVVIFFAISWYLREGRNDSLENLLVGKEFGSPLAFRGSLTIDGYEPGRSLQMGSGTATTRRTQFWYRLIGNGPQAIFDEVSFDGLSGLVQLKKKNSLTTLRFSELSAIQMREVGAGRAGSLWHIELIRQKGKGIPFVTSQIGDRRDTFEGTAAVAKAISAIVTLPVYVFVAGNVWTPGWPPKSSTWT